MFNFLKKNSPIISKEDINLFYKDQIKTQPELLHIYPMTLDEIKEQEDFIDKLNKLNEEFTLVNFNEWIKL